MMPQLGLTKVYLESPSQAGPLICRNASPAQIANGDVNTAERRRMQFRQCQGPSGRL
jgi:hypothetical protein